MNRRLALQALAALAASPVPGVLAARSPVQVFRDPQCGCCGDWVKHLEAAGFNVRVTLVSDTTAIRQRFKLPERFASCHTAVVGDYVLEGHVPVREVDRLLAERPAARGLAVPGMPVGAPGMQVPGVPAQAFDVLLVDKGGNATVYARYPDRPASREPAKDRRT